MSEGDKRQLDFLIKAVADGDSSALDGIFVIAAKRMLAAAYVILRNNAAAEDVVSDSFVKITRFAKKYRSDEPMAWILRIVRNTALDYVRAEKRRKEVDLEKTYSIADEGYSLERRETALELERAINLLPPDERKAIQMRYFLDMTVREAAKELRLTKSSAERLIKRAEENLKSILASGKKDGE